MHRIVLALCSCLALTSCTTAPQDQPRSAKERYADDLLDIVPPHVMFWQLSEPYARAFGSPQQQEKAHANFMRNVDANAVDAILRNALLKHFTEAELKALAAFYSTPEGRTCMAKIAPFAAEVVPACAREASKAYGKTASDAGLGRLLP